MRDFAILLSILALIGATAFAGDEVPQRLAFDRYTAMVNRSPFAVATAVAAPAATPNFAKDLYVANAAHTETGDFVTVLSASDKNFREYLATEKPNDHGYGISNIQWSDKPGETKVTITKDGQFASLSFNQALLQAPVSGNTSAFPPPMANGAMPNTIQPPPVNIPRPPPPQPAMNMPSPHVRGLIQRNPTIAPSGSGQPEQ